MLLTRREQHCHDAPSQLDTAEADYGSAKGNILNTFLRLDPKVHLKSELNTHQLMDVITEIIQE